MMSLFPRNAYTAAITAFLASVAFQAAADQASDILPKPVEVLIRSDTECTDFDARHLKQARNRATVGKTQTLYLVPCYAGAYNVIFRVYVLDTRYPDALRESLFAGYSDETGWYGTNALINAAYDPKTKILSAFEKGRGLGDCGSIPSFQWTGYNWRMVEYRYWGKCDGSRMPEQWPVLFRFKPTKK